MPSVQVEDIPSSPIADNGSTTSSFFAQEANSQHLLPMINEVDEDVELANGSTANSAPLFFAGRYTDGSSSRKRAPRTDDDADGMENVNVKRLKLEQVSSWSLASVLGLITMVSRTGPRSHNQQITPTLPRTCCILGTA